MDLGDWSIRHWRLLSGLTTVLLVVVCGMVGALTSYNCFFPALGGLNGLLYDLTLKISEPWRRDIPTAPAVLVAVDDASLSQPRACGSSPAFVSTDMGPPDRRALGCRGATDRIRCRVRLCRGRFSNRGVQAPRLRSQPDRQSRAGQRPDCSRAVSERRACRPIRQSRGSVTGRSSRLAG